LRGGEPAPLPEFFNIAPLKGLKIYYGDAYKHSTPTGLPGKPVAHWLIQGMAGGQLALGQYGF